MTKETKLNLIIAVAVVLAALMIVTFPVLAHATGMPKPQPHAASATSNSTSNANAAPIDLSLMNNPVAGDSSFRTGNSYSLVSSAPALPGGLCPKNRTIQVLLLFTFSEVGTEHECLDKVLSYMREAIPKPPVTNYITNNYSTPIVQSAPAECPKPAPKPARKKTAPPVDRCTAKK